MTPEEQQQVEDHMARASLGAEAERIKAAQQEMMMKSQDSNMIKEQLDLTDELNKIDYLLRGYTTEINEETDEIKWVKPKNNELIVLSDYGVHLVRNTIAWYINKDTLLSNYDDETIRTKMEDFSSDLNDTIFMEYEKVFQYPSLQDCQKELHERVKKKTDLKVFSRELLGKKLSDTEKDGIKDLILREIEPIVEKELEKIRQQIMKNKLKRFMLLIRVIQDIVHSTYNRAYQGQERKTLREHIHISETKGGYQIPQQQNSGFFGNVFRRNK